MLRRLQKNQRGQILVFTVLLIPIIFLFFAAAINAGVLYIEYTRLQNAADAAALAGASDYANYCKKFTLAAAFPEDFIKAQAEISAKDTAEEIVKLNQPNDKKPTIKLSEFKVWEEKESSATTSTSLLFKTVKYSYNAVSTVTLSETVPLLVVVNAEIQATAQAQQSFDKTERSGRWTGIVNKRNFDFNITDSKLTKLTQ